MCDPFMMVVSSEEKRIFTVVGPMIDDTELTHKVFQAQGRNLRVRCFAAHPGMTREQVIAETKRHDQVVYVADLEDIGL